MPCVPWDALGRADIRDKCVHSLLAFQSFGTPSFHFPATPSAFMWLKFPLLPARLSPGVHRHSAQLWDHRNTEQCSAEVHQEKKNLGKQWTSHLAPQRPAGVSLNTLPALHQLFLAACLFSQVTIPSSNCECKFYLDARRNK